MTQEKKADIDNVSHSSKVSEWAKKVLLNGLGAVFLTEEGIKSALVDMKLPKNVINAALSQAEKTKKEISGLIAQEVKEFLGKIELDEIIRKVLAGQSIEITAKINFVDDKNKKKAAPKAAASNKRTKL
ncbi:MAG: hypothetical protein KC505_06455 [Myxococcales bacterium]|nr:hypothetical protein [Myxococcales bacterium]USN51047.1 MAG: hypothetical protein H6731_01150 [Myxococcales bacterium]